MNGEDNELGINSQLSKVELRSQIDRMALSADAKALINDLSNVVIEVGGRLVDVGRQIVAFILDLARRYPNTAFGLIVAAVISSLIASIPLFGPILAPLLAPLLLAFGIAAGAIADLRNAPMNARIKVLEQHFATMANHG